MSKEELIDYLVDEAEMDRDFVEELDAHDLIDAWLKYNGIIGFTEDIIDVVGAALDIDGFKETINEKINEFLCPLLSD